VEVAAELKSLELAAVVASQVDSRNLDQAEGGGSKLVDAVSCICHLQSFQRCRVAQDRNSQRPEVAELMD
jgi:hypothetical protein